MFEKLRHQSKPESQKPEFVAIYLTLEGYPFAINDGDLDNDGIPKNIDENATYFLFTGDENIAWWNNDYNFRDDLLTEEDKLQSLSIIEFPTLDMHNKTSTTAFLERQSKRIENSNSITSNI